MQDRGHREHRPNQLLGGPLGGLRLSRRRQRLPTTSTGSSDSLSTLSFRSVSSAKNDTSSTLCSAACCKSEP